MATTSATFNTRICLKYDSFENWQASTLILKAGEVAVAVPGTQLADAAAGTNDFGAKSPCLIKVGDGEHKFSELPWLSALAADVHSWGKLSHADFKAWMEGTKTIANMERPALATASALATVASDLANLKTTVTGEGGIGARVTTLEGEMDTAQADIKNLQDAIGTGDSGLATKVAGLDTRLTTAEGKITTLEGKMATAESNIAKNTTDIGTNTTAIATLNAGDTTEGSVDYKVKAEADRAKLAEKANADAIAVLNGSDTTAGSVAKAVKDAVDAEKQARESAITALKTGEIKTAQDTADAAKTLAEANEDKVDTLIGTDTGKSARTIANEELAKQLIPENAAEALNTLEEIAKWIQDHPGDAAEMNAAIEANAKAISGIVEVNNTQNTNIGNNATAIGTINTNIGTVTNLNTTDKTVVGAINEVIAKIATDDAATLAAAKKYTDDEIVEFKDGEFATLSGKVTANTNKLVGIDTTVKDAIDAAKTAAAEDASNKAAATLASAQTYAEEKATAAQTAAKTYTDGEIDKVESTVSNLKEKVDNHIAIAVTGATDADGNLTLSLGGNELVIVFNCGSATEVI